MPVLEFALDANASNRIQVHTNTHQGPVSVMLNRTVIGSLATIEEQTSGKNFRLPDSSVLRVQILNGHPQAWRNGRPLLLTSAPPEPPPVEKPVHAHMSPGVLAFVILNLLVLGGLSLWFFIAAFMSLPASRMLYPFLFSGLLALVGLAGIFALLAWRRWGLYLALGYALVNFVLAIVWGIIDYRSFVPLATLALLTFSLHSTGVWREMK